MPPLHNKQELREEFIKEVKKNCPPDATFMPSDEDTFNQIADWWLQKFTSHEEEILQFWEGELETLRKEEDWNKMETDDYYAHEKIKIAVRNKIFNQGVSAVRSLLATLREKRG